MSAKNGFSPKRTLSRDRFAGRLIILLLTLLVSAVPASSLAQHGPVLTLGEAEDIALAFEPGQLALRARSDAEDAMAVAARDLPAPSLRIGLNNFPIERGGFSTEGMTNAGISLRQTLPRGETLELRGDLHERRARSFDHDADARERDVRQWVREAWLDVFYWSRVEGLLTESRPFFEDLVETTRSLYSVGRKNQQDVLRSELELSRLDDRLIDVSRASAQARAQLARWIDDAAYRPLPGSLPATPALADLDALEAVLDRHPIMQAADAGIEAAQTSVRLADQKKKPTWAFDAGYSYRDGTLPGGAPRSDFVTLGVTVDLPFFRKQSLDNELLAALKRENAEQASREQLLRRLRSQLQSEYARHTELKRRLALYDSRILEQSAANADAAMLAYQSDAADFSEVMRAYIDQLNTQVEFVRLEVELARSHAAIANLGGQQS